jgi:hypothetical protein
MPLAHRAMQMQEVLLAFLQAWQLMLWRLLLVPVLQHALWE